MAASDSFVGEGLNPSPYKEALAQATYWRELLECAAIVLEGYVADTEGEYTLDDMASTAASIRVALREGE